MSDSLVIIPTYNEKENVEAIIDAVFALEAPFHVLIVDDGSPDGTADIVKGLQADKYAGKLHILERTGKQGLGTAYIEGFKWAILYEYNYVLEMDADFSHNPSDLPRLVEACRPEGVGMSVGSRYIKGGKLINWPMKRVLMSRGASIYVRCITWMPVNDPTAGFVCYKRSVLETINFDRIKFTGYAFQIEMKYAVWQLGNKIKEVPITFQDRLKGNSKMSTSIFWEAFAGVLKIKVRSFSESYGRKR